MSNYYCLQLHFKISSSSSCTKYWAVMLKSPLLYCFVPSRHTQWQT